METLKVSTRSNPNAVAGAMAGVVRQTGAVQVQVVGAGALNQAIKAVAIARGYVAASGLDLICTPTFADITIDGESRTAIRLTIEDRARRVLDEHGEAVGGSPDLVAAVTTLADIIPHPEVNGTASPPSSPSPTPADQPAPGAGRAFTNID